jgi:membrane fusion protein, multidrug efflux system
MLLEAQERDQGAQSQLELSHAQSAGASSRKVIGDARPSADPRFVDTRAPRPQEPPDEERPIVKLPPGREDQHLELDRKRKDTPRKGLLRRHPFAFVVGLPLFILAAAGGSLYWDYAEHFETTDDAFIAARQFSIAPKVPGYITDVLVTDNQHVPAGGVIVRIDERDYRIALAQTQAQVAGAEANIENIDAQISVQQAQINADQAQVERVQAALVFAQQEAARYQHLAQTGYGSVQNAQRTTSQLNQQQAAWECTSDPEARAATNRVAEGTTRQRRREPRASQGSARPSATEPLLYGIRADRPASRQVWTAILGNVLADIHRMTALLRLRLLLSTDFGNAKP